MAAAVATLSANRASPWTYAGLFTITLSTLMYEIALTRIFSVTMYYHFAFVALSIALFGMTVGALIVYLQPHRFPDELLPRHLWLYSLLFSVAIAVCFITQLTIPFSPKWNLLSVWSVIITCAVISVPFILSGIVVCLALTRFPERVNRLYAADLVGAALGCVLLVFLLNRVDAPSAVILIAAVAGLGSLIFAFATDRLRAMLLSLAALMSLGAFGLWNAYKAEEREPVLRIVWAKELREQIQPYEEWNSFSRVTAGSAGAPTRPHGWGMSETLPADVVVPQIGMVIDGTAGTILTGWDGDLDSTDFLRYDISNLAHYIRNDADVLVIGVGGGRDILSALEFEQNSVTGVEINNNILKATNEAYGDFTGHLDRQPGVRMVNDEARSYITRNDERYDILQISLIDTWAATAAGAYALSENSLYTVEAWHTFMDRLKPGGVLTVSRWYSQFGSPPLETYRTVALAAEVLKQRGVENPRDHIIVYSGSYISGVTTATVLVSPQPFSAADRATLERETRRLKFDPVLTETEAADAHFEGLVSPQGPDAVIDAFDEDISPPTDDRPFFFQMAKLRGLFDGSAYDDTLVERATLVLAMLALAVLGLTAVCIVLPIVLTTERAAHRGMAPFYTYFSGIGLGFMLIEVSQLQRLNIFLGQPTYALTVVLFSVLLSSGIGSMLSETVARAARPALLVAPLAALLVAVIVFGIATPALIDQFRAESTPVRIGVAVGVLMPLGLLMGMPFPTGMSAASLRPGAPTAFLWGINGAMSVCASVMAMVIAVFFGISAAFWTGAACYGMAAASMAFIAYRSRRQAAEPEFIGESAPVTEAATS